MVRLTISSEVFLRLSLLIVWLFGVTIEACASSKHFGDFGVVRKTNSESGKVIVSLDEDARLFCQTNAPWKRCVWRPPRSGVRQLHCLFSPDWKKNKHVCPSFPEVHFDVMPKKDAEDKNICAIVVHNVQEWHEGNWRCEFELEISTVDNPAIVWDTVRLDARGLRYHP